MENTIQLNLSWMLQLCLLVVLAGCAAPSKNISFRSRLPTQEMPLLNRAENGGRVGLQLDVENQRFTFQPTDNLIANYNLANNDTHFSNQRALSMISPEAAFNYQYQWSKILVRGPIAA